MISFGSNKFQTNCVGKSYGKFQSRSARHNSKNILLTQKKDNQNIGKLYARDPEYTVRQSGGGAGSFLLGAVFGGAVMGTLGFLFAPQISRALLGEDQKLKLPSFLDRPKDPETVRQDLKTKIDDLHTSIDSTFAALNDLPNPNVSFDEADRPIKYQQQQQQQQQQPQEPVHANN